VFRTEFLRRIHESADFQPTSAVAGAGRRLMSRRRPGVLLELHSADRLVRELVSAELHRRGLRPNLLVILALRARRRTVVVSTGLSQPIGLALLQDGALLVSDRHHGRVVRVGEGGALIPVLEDLTVPAGLTPAPRRRGVRDRSRSPRRLRQDPLASPRRDHERAFGGKDSRVDGHRRVAGGRALRDGVLAASSAASTQAGTLRPLGTRRG
jgi:hypothetical protein